THEVRFEAAGYVSVVEEIEVAASEFLQVRLTPLTAVLDEILVLTGRPPRPDEPVGLPLKIDGAPWRSVLNLLEDQVPGIVVRRRGALGTGAAIWIRGVSTFQLSSAPDVYLDGVRIDTAINPNALHVLDMIHADEVARVSVFKGAASGAARGGANGTILIETNRGPSGRDGGRRDR
ncbi:MAG: TonB-dependent receptor plug domain-containing protein, partial [Acidobacteriota bacterium]|nr:TonB-dependent receptor plug domain-containing protein [Acidobacteriota bacterium]